MVKKVMAQGSWFSLKDFQKASVEKDSSSGRMSKKEKEHSSIRHKSMLGLADGGCVCFVQVTRRRRVVPSFWRFKQRP